MTPRAVAGRKGDTRGEADPPPARREPYVVRGLVVRPGHTSSAGLIIARLPTGGELSLPITVVHGKRPGPTLAVTAALHGDELNGTLAIGRLIESIDETTFAGTLLALPIVNPLGLLNQSRYLPDRRDLNRCFPGSRRGSLGSRIAYTLTTVVLERADVVIDLHTGSAGRSNWPQLRCNLDDPKSRRLAKVFGAPCVLHAGLRDGSLRGICAAQNRPVLVFEGGEALRADEWAIGAAHQGMLRVMRHLGMVGSELPHDSPEQLKKKPRLYKQSQWLRASRSGFCQLYVGLGDRIRPGDVLGTISNPAENTQAEVRTDTGGLVLGRVMTSLVNRGDALLHVATERYTGN